MPRFGNSGVHGRRSREGIVKVVGEQRVGPKVENSTKWTTTQCGEDNIPTFVPSHRQQVPVEALVRVTQDKNLSSQSLRN